MIRLTIIILGVTTLVCATSVKSSSAVKREENQGSPSSSSRQASSSNHAQTASQANLYYYYYPVQEKKQSAEDYETSASSYNPVSTSYGTNVEQSFDSSDVYQSAASSQGATAGGYGGQTVGFSGENSFTGGNFGGLGAVSDINQVNTGGYGGLGQLAAATGGYGVNALPGQAQAGGYGLGTSGDISQLTAAGYGGSGAEGYSGLGTVGSPALSQFSPGGYGVGFNQAGDFGGSGAVNGYGQFGTQGAFGSYGQGNYGGFGDLRPAASSIIGSTGGETQSSLGLGSLIMPMLALAGLGLILPSVSSSLTSSSRRKREAEDKMDIFSGYRRKLEKYYSIYRSAVENEECLNRVICELGNAMSDAKSKVSIIRVLEHFVPEQIRNKMEIFETAALSTKVGKCYKYKC